MLYILIVVVVTPAYAFVETHGAVHALVLLYISCASRIYFKKHLEATGLVGRGKRIIRITTFC